MVRRATLPENNLVSCPRSIRIVEDRGEILAPKGVLYSTKPRSCVGDDGGNYAVKGPEPEIVAPEAVAYALAGHVDLPVPDFAIAKRESGSYFASRMVDVVMRDVGPFVPKVANEIARLIVFDTWVCNVDRNMGGVLLEDTGGGRRMVAIDFEQSEAIRKKHPLVELASIEPRRLWPREELGKRLGSVSIPSSFVSHLQKLSDEVITGAVVGVQAAVTAFDWGDAVVPALLRRRDNLIQLVKEVWSCRPSSAS